MMGSWKDQMVASRTARTLVKAQAKMRQRPVSLPRHKAQAGNRAARYGLDRWEHLLP